MSSFDEAYLGVPPWDIGRPQPELVRAGERREVAGDVVDVGCGTGEHAIHFAAKGCKVLGVDSAPRAIDRARQKAKERGSTAEFRVWDALDLGSLGRTFDTALDSGLFHVFSDKDRSAYVMSLSDALRPGGRYIMLCFSDKEPTDWGGPRRIPEHEIRRSFSNGWRIEFIRPARFESNFHKDGGHAWLSSIKRA